MPGSRRKPYRVEHPTATSVTMPIQRSPRDPASIAVHVAYTVAGVLFGPLPFHVPSLTSALGGVGEDVWSYLLLVGGVLYLVGSFCRELQLILGLQAAGALLCASGLTIYVIAVLSFNGGAALLVSVLVTGFALAALLRGTTSMVLLWRVRPARPAVSE